MKKIPKLSILTLLVIIALISIISGKSDGAKTIYDTEYTVDGEKVSLNSGTSSLVYFGNQLITDQNNDGREDIVFIATRQLGGSGTFFYVFSAINTENGYIGSDGYFLGDRIAPQNITNSTNPKHKNVVVVNYADRASGEPMTVIPSIGKSVYLKLDTESMQWGIVEPNFEGESI
jgi:hypothetical protein